MTKPSPSPSPWKIQDLQIIASDGSVVCEIYDATEADIANAKLIATAPEMFEALILANSEMSNGVDYAQSGEATPAEKAIIAVLAKIKAES